MNEYLILFVLLALSLLILGLLVRVLSQVKRVKETAEAQAIELKPSERVAPEEDAEGAEAEKQEEEAPP
ncbi:hypothetical protein KAW53_05385 [Candidatus Bathyarchaeota archaeon]|jgi:Na+-transporting methylmalonyl-CoA/oxaloacetate decarboxylase gamma subunit|nr:hypothetical protein [Candidatus Bathyarchaeota archaeon]